MKTERLFALLDHLRAARRPLSAEAMAERLQVSMRTIYRDIATLQGIGAPIRGESGLGYQLEPGYFLPPLQFDAEEIEAIMLGLRLLGARPSGGLQAAAERVTGKIAAALGAEGSEKLEGLNLLAVAQPRANDLLAEPWGAPLRAAIRERRILMMGYHSLAGQTSQRRIEPLGLTLFDEVWLLTAWCTGADGFRNFRLDRLTSLDDTGERFRPRPGRRFSDYLATL